MLRHLIFLLAIASVSITNATDKLDDAWFGLEFRNAGDAVQISWIDSNHKTAKKLRAGDIVLSVGALKFQNAAELTNLLRSQEPGQSVRFEVLAQSDKSPRKVSVRSESIRDAVPRRFTRERDREAKEVLYVPNLAPTQLHIAVVEGFDGKGHGFRLRYYPNNAEATAGHQLSFWANGSSPSSTTAAKIATKPNEFHYTDISEEDQKKLPTLNRTQLAAVRRAAYVELTTDRTAELLAILKQPDSKRQNVGYGKTNAFVFNRHRLTDSEVRNLDSCYLLYQILTEGTEPKAAVKAAAEMPKNEVVPDKPVELPSKTAWTKAKAGWKLWQNGEFAGRYSDGHYTDPDDTTQVKDFWSNGTFARVDDTNDGLFETIFIVSRAKLKYIGSVDRNLLFMHVAPGEQDSVKQYVAAMRALRRP